MVVIMKRLRRYSIVVVAALCGVFGVSVALAAQHHRKHSTPGGFSVLSRHSAHVASAHGGLPSTAVFARTVGDNNVYAFERVRGLQAEICVADQLSETTATACGPTAAAEQEGMNLILPNLGTAPTVVVLVPNGVGAVSFVNSNGATSVGVVNNVAVAEGATTAYHYATPSGGQKTVALQG